MITNLNNTIEKTISKMSNRIFFSNSSEYNDVFQVSLYNDDFRNDFKMKDNSVKEFNKIFKTLNSDFSITDFDYDDDDCEYVRYEFKLDNK